MVNERDLRAKADSGDAGAQYQMAALLGSRGDASDSDAYLGRAAAAGHPGALFTTANRAFGLPPEDFDPRTTFEQMEIAVAAGSMRALRRRAAMKSMGLGVSHDADGASADLTLAAEKGDPIAMRECAAFCLRAHQEAAGVALMRQAGLGGDWVAAVIGLRRGGIFSEEETNVLLQQLRPKLGPLLLSDFLGAPAASPIRTAPNWQEVAQLIKAAPGAYSSVPLHAAAPQVVRFEGVLSAIECDYLIVTNSPFMKPSAVVDSAISAARQESYRTSDGTVIILGEVDCFLASINDRLAGLSGLPREHAELMGVLRYRPGQEYAPHHDYLPADENDYSEVKRSGQRVKTLLVPLNEHFDGGATLFPALGLEFKGRAGDAVLFENTDSQEVPIEESLHAGAPVTSGEKWMLTLWYRAKPFWFWDPETGQKI